jgi:8-oxo-dGTP pyrophosphatase MutT (NUDIX family)
VVTSFLRRPDGRILLLRRSDRVGSYRRRWAGVSGFLERETPLQRARIEIEEETGLPRRLPRLVRRGRPLAVRATGRSWKVYPFLFGVPDVPISLDWEHTQFEWVRPEAIGGRPTVPRLYETWRAVGARPRAARPDERR